MTDRLDHGRAIVASSRYAVYRGRYRAQVRLGALVLVVVLIATSHPYPSLHGRGLVILIALAVAFVSHAAATLAPARWPLVRNVVQMVASGVLAGYDPGTSSVLLVFAGLDAAASLPPSTGTYVTALAVVTDVLATLLASNRLADTLFAFSVVGGFLLGVTIRQFVLQTEQAELRLAAIERADIEQAKSVRLAGRADAAREIHDILAHNLGALVVQLDAVNALLESDHPNLDSIRPVLRDAHRHAVDGLAEARQAVSSLREDTKPLEDSLRQLVDAVPAATLEVVGATRDPSADVSIVVRRIAQEALTNAMKHAPGSAAAVRIEFQPASFRLTVTDGGRPESVAPLPVVATGGGYGIEGMQERAEMIGAAFEAGPDGPGWKVQLDVPDRPAR